MTAGRRRWESSPHTGICDLCGQALAGKRLIRRRGRWMHRDCWTAEKGE